MKTPDTDSATQAALAAMDELIALYRGHEIEPEPGGRWETEFFASPETAEIYPAP